jgi:hypothetical protein
MKYHELFITSYLLIYFLLRAQREKENKEKLISTVCVSRMAYMVNENSIFKQLLREQREKENKEIF